MNSTLFLLTLCGDECSHCVGMNVCLPTKYRLFCGICKARFFFPLLIPLHVLQVVLLPLLPVPLDFRHALHDRPCDLRRNQALV